jgi:glycosyltransferase involved in cell wall biosynthesis
MAETKDWFEISNPAKLPEKPTVSVLMLAYRHAPYLADAIEGVLLQKTNFSIELIIAEDCSPDDTRAIALDYQQRYPELIRVIASDHNVGMNANFKRAFETCRGEFVAFCEGDDYWHHRNKLALQIKFLVNNPLCGFVHTNYDYRVGDRVNQNMLSGENRTAPSGNALTELLAGYWLGTATIVYRTKVLRDFENSNLAKKSYHFGDYNRALFTALTWQIGYLPISTSTYRYMPGSAMNSGTISTLRLRLSVIECRKEFMKFSGCEPKNLIEIEINENRLLYSNAYMARDHIIFDSAATWLNQNDIKWKYGFRHVIRWWLIRLPFLHKFVIWRANKLWENGIKNTHTVMTRQQQIEYSELIS